MIHALNMASVEYLRDIQRVRLPVPGFPVIPVVEFHFAFSVATWVDLNGLAFLAANI